MLGIFIPFVLSALLFTIDFLYFLLTGKRFVTGLVGALLEVSSVLVAPFIFLSVSDFGLKNDCCNDSAFFSPGHRISIYVLIVICVLCFYYSKIRSILGPPLVEVIISCMLLTGIILNIFIAVHEAEGFWLIGNLPIIIIFFFGLVDNHKLFMESLRENRLQSRGRFTKTATWILKQNLFVQIPVLFVITLPLLTVISFALMLFGQKPDAMIRAFTDTYKLGLSQIDYQCEDVVCPSGHYLCTIAAKGHRQIVKPLRFGIRGNREIICNRQLLVSNAFEELVQERLPGFHKVIRRFYDRIGALVHHYYSVFNNKFVSDFIYILMKPLEWVFLVFIYCLDQRPESRISNQYLSSNDRRLLEQLLNRLSESTSK